MVLGTLAGIWDLAKKIERLTGVERETAQTIAAVNTVIADLDRRVTRLEAREEIVVARAEGQAAAAATAATAAAAMAMAQLAMHLGALSERVARSTEVQAQPPFRRPIPNLELPHKIDAALPPAHVTAMPDGRTAAVVSAAFAPRGRWRKVRAPREYGAG